MELHKRDGSVCVLFVSFSAEEGAEGFLDLAYGMEADGELLGIDALEVVLRDDDVAEAELLGLGNALLDAGHRTYLARQTHLAAHTPAGLSLWRSQGESFSRRPSAQASNCSSWGLEEYATPFGTQSPE